MTDLYDPNFQITNNQKDYFDYYLTAHFEAIEEAAKLTTHLFSSITQKISECENDYEVQ